MTMTGTWEEIEAFSDKLRGKQVRLTIVHPADTDDVILPANPLPADDLEQMRRQARQALSQAWPAGLAAVDALREDRR